MVLYPTRMQPVERDEIEIGRPHLAIRLSCGRHRTGNRVGAAHLKQTSFVTRVHCVEGVLILPCARKSQRCSTTGSKNKHAFLSIWCQGMYQTLDFIIPPFAAGLIGRKGVWKQQGKKCNDSA
ncbi:predicted protein [Sclerotinia sclerotiorum 1980 UF-70]|uniref:Uncharacterized protein n=1 Tax=Sclerotinia sclerotiorum (strain ATCC 18683 / 1980 / Ss-1) TaxID=665079 RepID=A7F634_SCLS1|nr:predicted protein [Sclerotinia sclerotiorum 1980 UF-70]EDN98205.1 predicted protein [Sclerotinia sclerotiorum 1980 UF-70]